MSGGYRLPVVDLDLVSDEQALLPEVERIIRRNDTFLLKNYANKGLLDELMDILQHEDVPDVEEGFDANFTGVLKLQDDILLEQYIFNTDQTLKFDRECTNESLRKLYVRLFKVGLFFLQLCMKSVAAPDLVTEKDYSSIFSRYYRQDSTTQVLPNGETFEYVLNRAFRDFVCPGILTVFPVARGIKIKPPTVSADDNTWMTIDEPDCLLIHTGTLLAQYSGGVCSSSRIQISPESNAVYLTLAPPLAAVIDSTGKTVAEGLLKQQILELPEVAKKFYPREAALMQITKMIAFYKELFSITETVLSLYAMSRTSLSAPKLDSILPQISNMMRKKISQQDFLKMIFLWPECYVLEADSRGDLTVKLPRRENLLISKSRRLEFVEKADKWLNGVSEMVKVPTDVPVLRSSKRRGSGGTDAEPSQLMKARSPTNAVPPSSNYISNSKDKFMYTEKKTDSQSNLLERLRERERRSAALLSQRQRQYDQFLAVKMKQVFEILYSLPQSKPYTATHLSSLIVDSLQDSNNPIGTEEAAMILDKLQTLLGAQLIVQTVDGGLKVYRWNSLDKGLVLARIENALDQFMHIDHL